MIGADLDVHAMISPRPKSCETTCQIKSYTILYYTPEYFMGFSESLAAYKMLGQFVNLPNESRLLLLCLRTRGSCTDGIQCQCQAGGLLFLELTRPVGAAVARLH